MASQAVSWSKPRMPFFQLSTITGIDGSPTITPISVVAYSMRGSAPASSYIPTSERTASRCASGYARASSGWVVR